MSNIENQITTILYAIEILRVVKVDDRYDFVCDKIDIEALLDATETLTRVHNLVEYLNPED